MSTTRSSSMSRRGSLCASPRLAWLRTAGNPEPDSSVRFRPQYDLLVISEPTLTRTDSQRECDDEAHLRRKTIGDPSVATESRWRLHQSRLNELTIRELHRSMVRTRGRHSEHRLQQNAGEVCQDREHDPRVSRTEDIHLDHVVEVKDGGAKLDRNNVLFRCRTCHSRKTVQAKSDRAEREYYERRIRLKGGGV